MESDLFLRKLSALQACIRGFLVRRQFQSLRAEYEAIVQEIEGDLGTLQWTGGWIPKPVFLPKEKSHRFWKAKKIPNPEQKLWSHFPCKDSEKGVVWEEMVLKKTEESPANSGSVCRDDSPWLRAEQGKKGSQGKTRDNSISKVENTATDLGLSQRQHKLQDQRNHLAMELLWLQQAINSRKEYLILKQTLRPPETSQTRDKSNVCLDHKGQAYEKTWLQPSRLLEEQSCRDRTIGEPHYVDDAYKDKSQPQKSPDSLANTDKAIVGAKGRELCYRKTGPQLPAALESQAGGDRTNKRLDHGGQAFNESCLQQLERLADQTPGDPKPRSPCSGKATTQLPILCENPNPEDKHFRKPSYKVADCQRARPYDLSISEGHMIWDGTLAGLEHGSSDLKRTKPPKSQPPQC